MAYKAQPSFHRFTAVVLFAFIVVVVVDIVIGTRFARRFISR
jgi:hypothetical protein